MHEIFSKRQTKRSFLPDQVPSSDTAAMLEAFRFAPSSANTQPWRIVVTSPKKIESALSRGNAAWAPKAPLAFVVCGEELPDVKPNNKDKYLFDVGLAAENLILQAVFLGYQASPTGGWDEDKIKELLAIPAHIRVICIVFVGKPGRIEDLDEITRPKDEKPRTRKEIGEIIFNNKWGESYKI